MRNFLAILFLALTLSACQHGRDFAKPSPESLILGKTTRADILRQYGNPFDEEDSTEAKTLPATTADPYESVNVAGTIVKIHYLHYDTAGTLAGNVPNHKIIFFEFWNDKLVSYNYSSDFSDSSSNFDESKIGAIKKGQTKPAEIVGLFGPPTGGFIYPIAQYVGDKAYIYEYSGYAGTKHDKKRLSVIFTQEDVVRDFRFSRDVMPSQP